MTRYDPSLLWKLIRIFQGGDNGAHRWKLFNLRDDLGEKSDLARRDPERVKEYDVLIERFLADTKAVVPVPNPAFDPMKYRPDDEGTQKPRAQPRAKASANAPSQDAGDPMLQGWKARNGEASAKDGIVTVKGRSNSPFLGVGAGATGPAVVTFRVLCTKGGARRVEWIAPRADQGSANSVPFTLKPGDWQTVTVTLPAQGPLGILRLYVPAQQQPVEVDWIELRGGKTRRWDFWRPPIAPT